MEEEKSNNKGKIIGIVIIALIAIVAFCCGYYYYKSNVSKTVFVSAINKGIDKYEENISKTCKTQDVTLKLSGNINSDNDDAKKVAEYINKSALQLNTQIDYENKNALIKLGVDYDNDKLIGGRVYYNSNDKMAYGYIEELFDKYFKMDLSSSDYNEMNETFNDIFETQSEMKLGEKVSLKKAVKILKEEISDKLNKEYFSKENCKINVASKEVKTTKFKLILTEKQFVEMLQSICKELSENDDFLECWEEKDKIKDALVQLSNQLNETEKNDEVKIEFNIYKKGILNKFVKFEINMYEVNNEDEKISFDIVKENDKRYLFNAKSEIEKENVEFSGDVNIEKIDSDTYKYVVGSNIPEFGNITLNIEVSNKLNGTIENVNKSDAVSLEDLTEEEQETIYNNLQKMKLYEVLQNIYKNNPIEDVNTGTDNNIDTNKGENEITTTTNTSNQSIKDYSGKIVVSYGVPANFVLGNYSEDTYKIYRNENSDVKVTVTMQNKTLDEFSKEIDKNKEYFEETKDYTDVKATDLENKKVNNKDFKIRTLSYTYKSSISSEYDIKYKTMYIYYDIDGENSYNVEIENADNITENEINQFLNITK